MVRFPRPLLLLLAIVALAGIARPGRAEGGEPGVPAGWSGQMIDPRSDLNRLERRAVQAALTWTAGYNGPVDGEWTAQTEQVLRSWRSTQGMVNGAPTVSRAELLALLVAANRAHDDVGWTTSRDPNTGFWFGWPERAARPPMPVRSSDSNGSDYEARGGSGLRLMTRVMTGDPRRLVEQLTGPGPTSVWGPVRVTFRVNRDDQQIAMLQTNAVSIYLRFDQIGSEWRGFVVTGRTGAAPLWLIAPMNIAFSGAAESAEPALDQTVAPILTDIAALAAKPGWLQGATSHAAGSIGVRPTGSGTAFVVRRDGAMLTNAHVVNGCAKLALADGTAVALMAVDPKRDLALVKAAHPFGAALSFRRDQTIDLGETVRAFGFPYYRLISESLNITEGIVTSQSGPGDNATRFQMSANLQPGNSGGPVLDEAGNVIGISVAVLNPVAVARLTGTMPQGMNYAVRGAEALAFMSDHGVDVTKVPNGHAVILRDVAKSTAPLVFPILCFG